MYSVSSVENTQRGSMVGTVFGHLLPMAKRAKKGKPNFIALWRDLRGLNQIELGAKINRTQATVVRYESGEIDIKFSVLSAIARVLRCDPEDLYRKPTEMDQIRARLDTLSKDGQDRAARFIEDLRRSEASPEE